MRKPELDLGGLRLTELQSLVSLWRAGSAAKAARAISVPTSQITRALRRLEASLGETLVEQRAGALGLTALGKQRAERFAAFLNELRSPPVTGTDPSARELTVFAPSYLLPVVQVVMAEICPGVLLRLVEGTQMLATTMMTNGQLDLALLVNSVSAPTTFAVEPAGSIESKLHVRESFSRTVGARLRAEHAAGLTFVAPMHRTDRGMEAGNDHCPLPLHRRQVGVWVSTIIAAMQVASRNDYAVFGPTIAAAWFGPDLRAIDVPGWNVSSELFVAAHVDRIYAAELRALSERLRKLLTYQKRS